MVNSDASWSRRAAVKTNLVITLGDKPARMHCDAAISAADLHGLGHQKGIYRYFDRKSLIKSKRSSPLDGVPVSDVAVATST